MCGEWGELPLDMLTKNYRGGFARSPPTRFPNRLKVFFDNNPDVENLFESPLSLEEIENSISRLKDKKAVGDDWAPAEVFKYIKNWIAPVIEKICIQIHKTGKMSREWKSGTVVTLYKKGNDRDCDNF